MSTLHWIIALIYSGYPTAAKVWAKQLLKTPAKDSTEETSEDSSEDSPDDIREVLSSAHKHSSKAHHRDDFFQGIQPAYTIGVGPKGGALILLFKQRVKGTKNDHARDAYLRDRLYYNKMGQRYCEQMNIKYRGSDSGLYQRHDTFTNIISVFPQNVRKKITDFVSFTQGFHFTGVRELEARAKGRFLLRKAYDVGNGQGLQYQDPKRSPRRLWPFGLWDVPLSNPVAPKDVILPDDIMWIPATADEKPPALLQYRPLNDVAVQEAKKAKGKAVQETKDPTTSKDAKGQSHQHKKTKGKSDQNKKAAHKTSDKKAKGKSDHNKKAKGKKTKDQKNTGKQRQGHSRGASRRAKGHTVPVKTKAGKHNTKAQAK